MKADSPSNPQGMRLKKLANLGGLVTIAQLDNYDPALLLGALLEIAERLPVLSSKRLELLTEHGISILKARNSFKRAYPFNKTPYDTATTMTLNRDDIRSLLLIINGHLPALEKDWTVELKRLLQR